MSLPLKHVRVEQNQRADTDDFLATNTLALQNLFLALKHGFAPNNGWLQPGAISYAGPGMACELVAPVAVITDQGLAIMSETATLTPGNGDGSNPRIDLVSAYWSEVDASSETRQFMDQATGVPYGQSVDTRTEWKLTAALTAGTPAADPVRPATPANHVALWEILVPTGATDLTGGTFTLIPSDALVRPQLQAADAWPAATEYFQPTVVGETFTSTDIFEVEIPDGRSALFLYAVVLYVGEVNASANNPVFMPYFRASIIDEDGVEIGYSYFGGFHAPMTFTAIVMAHREGPVAKKAYQLRLANPVGDALPLIDIGSEYGAVNQFYAMII